MSGLPKIARIEEELAKRMPSEADVLIEKIKAELMTLLRQQAPERLKRRRRWTWLLSAGVLGVIIFIMSAIVQGARGLD